MNEDSHLGNKKRQSVNDAGGGGQQDKTFFKGATSFVL